ncbi:hypothetical protein IW261DRAFT_1577065 [Armillaria novae-zelandiae]|uniref:Uncharacterized protein n=1 Tax=Armillaria novae-zelandiae TaxID=153914 RepID=A0AA39N9F2_9AGAR|nr:hypothetical protein IW261DRAFT_1577065 [Armillaria novae-zelandiae]
MAAYKLKLPPHWKIHPTFNEKLLTPFMPPAFPNQEVPPPPPPDLIKDEEEYKIEESPSDGNITADLADDPEHPVAQFLSIFLSPEFVTPKRPQCKFTAIRDLTADQKLFNIDVILGDIVPDSQGESLEQYGIGLRHEQIQEEPSPLLGKRKAQDEVEAL